MTIYFLQKVLLEVCCLQFASLHIFIDIKMKSKKEKTYYFRRTNNQTFALTFHSHIITRTLHMLLAKKQSIFLENIVLIHKGKVLDINHTMIQLSDKSIIHVVDKEKVGRDSLKIILRGLHNQVKSYFIRSDERIANFIRQKLVKLDEIPHFYIGLVYLGKLISPQKTFMEEMVEDQCQMVVVNIEDYIKIIKRGKKQISQIQETKSKQLSSFGQAKKDSQDSSKLLMYQEVQKIFEPEKKDNEIFPQNFNIQTIKDEITNNQTSNQKNEQHLFDLINEKYNDEPLPSIKAQNQQQQQKEIIKREHLGQTQFLIGNFIYVGPQHKSETINLIQDIMTSYSFMLQ